MVALYLQTTDFFKRHSNCFPALVVALVSWFALSACRLEISFNQKTPAHTVARSGTPIVPNPTVINHLSSIPNRIDSNPSTKPEEQSLPQETATPSPTPTATPVPATSTPTSTIKPSVTLESTMPVVHNTPTLTPTPVSLLPALSSPDHIIAPTINLDAPVENVSWSVIQHNGVPISTWVIPENTVGWHINSALPGHGGNVVLSGHHNLGGEVFRSLVDLKLGDKITLRADGRDYHYAVTDHFIVLERGAPDEQRHQNAQWIMPTVDERLTMISCWPYVDNSHRLIVVAKPIGNDS